MSGDARAANVGRQLTLASAKIACFYPLWPCVDTHLAGNPRCALWSPKRICSSFIPFSLVGAGVIGVVGVGVNDTVLRRVRSQALSLKHLTISGTCNVTLEGIAELRWMKLHSLNVCSLKDAAIASHVRRRTALLSCVPFVRSSQLHIASAYWYMSHKECVQDCNEWL